MTSFLPALTARGLAAAFGALAELRHGKPLHPKGVVVTARLHRVGGLSYDVAWLDTAGEERALVRVSRAVGLPDRWPDVLGLAIQVQRGDARHDLLLASSARPRGLRHLLVPGRDSSAAFFSSVFTYDTPRGRVVFGAAREPGGFALLVAPVRGDWTRFGTLTLSTDADEGDRALSLDPVLNPLPGLSLTPVLAALREPSYAAARRHRPADVSSTDEGEQDHVARLAGAIGS